MEAALALRGRDAEARITVVSDEHDHFFSRPALMYIFAGQTTLRDTEPYDHALYERMAFDRVRKRVATIDAAGHALVFSDGQRLAYDKLLLAVGSKARPAPWPGAEGPGVHYFVTLRDLEGLDREARKGMRAVVIGGGLIGVEVAEVLHDRGLHVTFVIRENWYFPAALDARESAVVAEHMRGHGVDVRLAAGVDRVERGTDGRPTGVRIGTEVLKAELVISSIGVMPNTAFLAGGEVALHKNAAIEVDDALRTGAPDVWAAGDCANVTWADGSRRPEQLWYTARDQGRAVALSMLGDEVAYRRGTWYNSAKFFDIEWTTAGWVPVTINFDGTPLDLGPEIRTWFQRIPGTVNTQKIVTKGDRVVGFNFLGTRWNHEPLLGWIHERRSLEWVLKHLHEAQFDEEFMPRFRVLPSATVS
jgi:NADPH-dependent 2,4-dienoyl-CoA reductase/sulfur reductase-like enzyme